MISHQQFTQCNLKKCHYTQADPSLGKNMQETWEDASRSKSQVCSKGMDEAEVAGYSKKWDGNHWELQASSGG